LTDTRSNSPGHPLRHNLLLRFSLVAFIATGLTATALAVILGDRIRRDAIRAVETEAVASITPRVLGAIRRNDLTGSMTGERAGELTEFFRRSILSDRIARLTIWSPDGMTLYTTNGASLGQPLLHRQHLLRAMRGEVAIEIHTPREAVNAHERDLASLVEVYAPLTFPGDRTPSAVLQIDEYYQPTAERIQDLQRWTYAILAAGSVVLYLALVVIVAGGWRTILHQRSSLAEANSRLVGLNQDLAAAQEPLSLLLNTVGQGIFGVDLHGVIDFANPTAADLLGWEVDELIGRSHTQLLQFQPDPLAGREVDSCPVCATLHDGERHRADDLRLRRKDGSWFEVEYTSTPLRREGELAGAVVVFSDVTERKRAEQALWESQRALSTLLSNLPGMAYRCRSDQRWTMEFASQGCLEITGYLPAQLVDSAEIAYGELIHPDDREVGWSEVQAAIRARRPFQLTYRIRAADGSLKWVWEQGRAVEGSDGSVAALEGFITDITERVRLEEQLEREALYDPLTGLPNRALFMDRLRQVLQRATRRRGYQFAVLFFDLDRFKVANDTLGHPAGDRILVSTARRLEVCIRQVDTAARLNADEFAILLDDISDPADATRVAERVLGEFDQPFDLDGRQIYVSASIGIAVTSSGSRQAEEILREADFAMHRAKASGKARYALFDAEMHARAMELLQIETELRRALERDEFRVHYQPIVELASGRITGFEALVRWDHPERGLLLPETFLEVAEETGLVVALGRRVLDQACRQLAVWQETFTGPQPLLVSVNLSDRQFMQPDLVEQVAEALRAANVPPESLFLEITEKVVMEDAENPEAVLDSLRALGVGLAVDDFGTGYSSLSVLHRFPVRTLKIAQSFVETLCDECGNDLVVRAIILLAQNIGMDVVAEGVETREQAIALRKLGCHFGQGFLFSPPLPPETATEMLARQMRK
jgi:diguanylate cyclase (GGDEF)-like protein/PAS domain S-box-containing protein